MPRGRALGYTLNLPDEDRYLKTREELIDYMTMLLGGRAAEQLVFGAVTTGASDDLRRASEVAGAMITDYAMGTTVAVTGRGAPSDERVSEQTLRLRDEEREELLHEARAAANAAAQREPRDARRAGGRAAGRGGPRALGDRADRRPGRAAAPAPRRRDSAATPRPAEPQVLGTRIPGRAGA